ncbi:hypothetical protein C8Q78DRAFT_39914 [Trametes maxima]|nr:hypothetical protein C8Q78DRAFT_39914 [Trametes maxima]
MDYNSAAWLQTHQISDLQAIVHDERSAAGSNDWKEAAASVQGGGLNDFLGDLQVSHSPTPPLSQGPTQYPFQLPHLLLNSTASFPTVQYSSQWGQAPSLPLSSYSSLNGATTTSSQAQSASQGQGQGQSSAQSQPQGQATMVIDPALTTMNGSSSSPPPQFAHPSYFTSSAPSRPQYQYQQSAHQPMLSMGPASPFMHTVPSHYTLPQQQQQHSNLVRHSHSPTQPQQQGTLSPYALHSQPPAYFGGGPIPTTSFYGQSSPPVASSSSASSSVSQSTPQPLTTPPPTASTSKVSAEQERAKLVADVKPLIQPNSFTGGGAVSQLVTILDDFGITDVEPQIRLDVLTRIRDNAGNHYFRAWVDNSIAMEVIREWLKLAFVGRNEMQLVETIMPLLQQIIDRLPLTLEKLKESKLGKLIMKLMKEPPTPAIKDMASNLERKWRKMLSEQEVPNKAESENTGDSKGKKRRADSASSRSAPPAKKTAVPAAGSSTPKAVPVKKDAKPVVKDAKSDSSFFSKPKPTKKEMPSFKKNPAPTAPSAASGSTAPVKKEPDPNVAQPSQVDAFQEILKSLGTIGGGSSNSTPPPAGPGPTTGPPTGSVAGPTGPPTLGKRKKSVTWAPDSQLEQIKLIERAIYDDDGASGSLPTHTLRDLDRDEGAALHNHLFEEQMEWTEPQPLAIPPELEIAPRGGESHERAAQEEREQSALVVSYASPAQIPDSPAEPPTQIPEEQVDEGVRLMLTGSDVDAIFWSDGAPALVDTIRPSTSVADLVGQLAAAPPPDVVMGEASQPPAGVSPIGGFSPETIQQLMQQAQALSQNGALFGGFGAPATPAPAPAPSVPAPAPAPTPHGGGEQGWAGQYEFDRGYHEPNGAGRGAEPNRGRGDGFRNTKRKPCSFFQAGRCRYGDQCDFSHEPLNYN